jgi:hypothetical protein
MLEPNVPRDLRLGHECPQETKDAALRSVEHPVSAKTRSTNHSGSIQSAAFRWARVYPRHII